jgi:long-chain acyl-CoA synthetase
MKKTKPLPFAFLDAYRGKKFNGEWPTLPEMFEITVERFGERNCFTDFEGPNGSRNTLTYNQAYEKIITLAKWMNENKVKKGSHVAVTGKNSPEWTIVYLAALFAGATIVPIDYGLHKKEIDNLLNTAKPTLFFVDEEKYSDFANEKSAFF